MTQPSVAGHPRHEEEGTIPMMHYLCGTCGMSATMVATPTGALAWADHMDTHADPSDFMSWTWSVIRLF